MIMINNHRNKINYFHTEYRGSNLFTLRKSYILYEKQT